jgi:predicted  nucleic acid-binding Zn-ribbon protein
MDMKDWVMLVTALGGIEGVKQLLKWLMSRKTNARIEDAHADVEEFKALREYNEFLQKQLSEKEQRFVEQTDRLRKVQDELFTLKETNSDLKLELALKRCERKNCGNREPQNGY